MPFISNLSWKQNQKGIKSGKSDMLGGLPALDGICSVWLAAQGCSADHPRAGDTSWYRDKKNLRLHHFVLVSISAHENMSKWENEQLIKQVIQEHKTKSEN